MTLLLFLFITFSHSQTLNELYKNSIEAYKKGDYQEFNKLNKKALKLHPSHPTLLYNLAGSYSLLNKTEKAYEILNKLLSWNVKTDFEKDTDFENLLNSKQFFEKLKTNKLNYSESKINSTVFLELPSNDHIEDFVIIDDCIYYTDVHRGEILKHNLKNKSYTRISSCKGSALAIAKDKEDKNIWYSSSTIKYSKDFNESDLNQSFIYEIQLSDSKINCKIAIPNKSVIGSLVISNNNKLYATSSLTPEIYVINTKTKMLEKTIVLEDAFNLQGITLDKDINYAYVADYIKGIVKINLKDFEDRVWINSNEYLLKGIDGLNFVDDNTLIAMQNNSTPKRVIKIKHNSKNVSEIEILDNDLLTKGDPTCGKFTEDGFFYISNSQWPFYDKESKPITDKWETQKVRLLKDF